MRRDRRFPLVLSKCERLALQQLAQDETLSAAAVMRRLIISEARRRGLWPGTEGKGGQRLHEPGDTGQGNDEARS